MQFSPLPFNKSTKTATGAATLAFCQTLATPLSFWEYNQQQQRNNNKNDSTTIFSNANVSTSQIVAEDIVVDLIPDNNEFAKVSRLSQGSEVSFTIKLAAIDYNALFQEDKKVVPQPGSGNVFICNNCLLAIKPIQQGEELLIDPATLDAYRFMQLDQVARIKLVGFTEPALRAVLSSELKLKVESLCPKLDVYRANDTIGEALRCIAPIEEGEVLYNFNENNTAVFPFATLYTMCNHSAGVYGCARHFNITAGCQCIAHSCDPNTIIDNDSTPGVMKVTACKKINPGDIVSFNYCTTEWDMDAPFDCACGSEKCLKRIAGFRNLKKEDQERLLQDPKANGISDYIVTLAKATSNGASDACLRYVAPQDFSRGAIVSAGIGRRLKVTNTATVNGTAAGEKSIFYSSPPSQDEESIISSSSSSSAKATFFGDVTGVRNRECFFVHYDVPLNTTTTTSANEQQQQQGTSTSTSLLGGFFENLTTTSTTNSNKYYTPAAAQVDNTIVALRDIKKGEVVTVRNIIAAPATSSTEDDDEKSATASVLDELTAQKLSAHILQIGDDDEDQMSSIFASIQGTGLDVIGGASSSSSSIKQQNDFASIAIKDEAKALEIAGQLFEKDSAMSRSSLLVLLQQDQVGALFLKNRVRPRVE